MLDKINQTVAYIKGKVTITPEVGIILGTGLGGLVREIEKQESSFKALNEQKEIMDLRLKASVNQLQQLKME